MLTKADTYMRESIASLYSFGSWDKSPRPKYEDGEPAHTLFKNHNYRTYNLSIGEFPILTLRPIAWKTAIKEIFIIYQKQTNNIAEMAELGCGWWSPWDIGDGTIGQRYGATVKKHNLINKLIEDIKTDPYGRRKVMSLWQEEDLKATEGLAPCAYETIWNVRDEYLDMVLIQRSGDLLMASGPGCVNEVQYAALLMMIAKHCGLKPGIFSHFVANEHLYDRHIEAADILLERYYSDMTEATTEDNPPNYPMLVFNPKSDSFFEFTIDDFELINYEPQKPQLSLPIGI